MATFVLQKDKDSKNPAKAPQKWFEDNKANVLEWPSESLGLNPKEFVSGLEKRVFTTNPHTT